MTTETLQQYIHENCPAYKGDILWLDITDSTNRIVKEYAVEGKECLAVADRQSAGRGRYNRGFVSELGGLYMSICLKVAKEKLEQIAQEGSGEDDATFVLGERLIRYPVQAGEAVAKALSKVYQEDFEIKLPNDVLYHKKKVVGILMEAVHHNEDIFLIFGIGVNLENLLPEELDMADNLLNLTGKRRAREAVCVAIIKEIMDIL